MVVIYMIEYLCYFIFADGYVIGHYANNARDFLYPAVPPYPGSGREVTLFKTSLFNPIRITVSNTNHCHSFMLLKSMLFVNCMGPILGNQCMA